MNRPGFYDGRPHQGIDYRRFSPAYQAKNSDLQTLGLKLGAQALQLVQAGLHGCFVGCIMACHCILQSGRILINSTA
jgi:hypothetical protein